MDFTYGPALPLGMEARREVLEFRSDRLIGEAEFLRRVNRGLPGGIRFSGLERVPPGSPSLASAIEALVYSLDRTGEALGRPWQAGEIRSALGRIRAAGTGEAALRYALRGRRLVLTLPPSPAKGARAQDIVRDAFGVEAAVFHIRRDAVRLRN
jgi:hypothetical protein